MQEELGDGRVVLPVSSPIRQAGGVKVKEKERRKRACMPAVEDGQLSPKKKKNSDMYAKVKRPKLFQDDEVFNSLSADRAGKVCYQNCLEEEKKKLKSQLKNAKEKCDDIIKSVVIPAGEDNAKNQLNVEARKLLRPVVKDISKMMEWFPITWTEVIRNLPLAVYGLQDGVSTKAIEMAHDLTSTLEIKMFSPSNLRSSASLQRRKAFTDREGSLIVEQDDMYEELKSTDDVLMAWTTLDCVWQKVRELFMWRLSYRA